MNMNRNAVGHREHRGHTEVTEPNSVFSDWPSVSSVTNDGTEP